MKIFMYNAYYADQYSQMNISFQQMEHTYTFYSV